MVGFLLPTTRTYYNCIRKLVHWMRGVETMIGTKPLTEFEIMASACWLKTNILVFVPIICHKAEVARVPAAHKL